MENRFKTFTMTEAKKFVYQQAKKKRYISREKKDEYVKSLVNENDQALIECIYRGIKGRADKEGSFEEIINLRKSDIHREEGYITLVKNNGNTRDVYVDDGFIELLLDTYKQDKYLENNGEEIIRLRDSGAHKRHINHVEDFIFRKPGEKKLEQYSPSYLNGKMIRFQNWLDNQYLTYNAL
jgi:integrase